MEGEPIVEGFKYNKSHGLENEKSFLWKIGLTVTEE